MKKILLMALVVLSTTWMFTGNSFAAEEKGIAAPQEDIVIAGEKKSARFPHSVHLDLGVTCGQCHHDSKHQPLTDKDIGALESSQQLDCVNCHNKDFADPKLQSMKDVFHARCKTCHQEGVAGKTGPTKCSACHVK